MSQPNWICFGLAWFLNFTSFFILLLALFCFLLNFVSCFLLNFAYFYFLLNFVSWLILLSPLFCLLLNLLFNGLFGLAWLGWAVTISVKHNSKVTRVSIASKAQAVLLPCVQWGLSSWLLSSLVPEGWTWSVHPRSNYPLSSHGPNNKSKRAPIVPTHQLL